MTNEQKLREALQLILPLAKGYAAEHNVGSNAEYVRTAEEILSQPTSDEGTPLTDAEIKRSVGIASMSGMEQAWEDMCHFAKELERTLHAKERELADAIEQRDAWRKLAKQNMALLEAQSVSAAPQGKADDRHLSHHPQECPITGAPFFMTIEHPERGMVATYGGPLDSYTIPERDEDDGQLIRERYDHDEGAWKDGYEAIGLYVVDEEELATARDTPPPQPAPQETKP